MLNTKKLLYILPDLAYIADLLPAKKEHEFAIQSFRQINGEFLDENEFVEKNLAKLVEKIESDEYHLILPDFLFTNTIVEVNESSDHKIQTYIKETLLPSLEITKDSHDIETTLLTEYNGKSKIQFSALEKSLLNAFRIAAHKKEIKILDISPLSWTLKSIISLEPSISVVQIGTRLYLAQHYIGVDQTISFGIDETENIAETIKTLKGAEASIQTVYLITNQLVEEKLTDHLKGTLPLQQLATFSEDENGLPSYVKKIIETGMKTLSISDFPVPKFPLGKISKTEIPAEHEVDTVATDIPQPSFEIFKEEEETEIDSQESEPEDKTEPPLEPSVLLPATAATTVTLTETQTELTTLVSSNQAENKSTATTELEIEVIEADDMPANHHSKMSEPVDLATEEESTEPEKNATIDDIDLSHFAPLTRQNEPTQNQSTEPIKKKIIKNSNDTNHMLKMIFITIATLFITVAIGVGLGIGFLYLSNRSGEQIDQTPVVTSPEPTTAPSPSPSPSPEPTIDKAEISILVVNATTTAGKAGTYKTLLTEDGFEKVDAANAKGEYDTGSFVLMTSQNAALVSQLEAATDLTLTYSDEKSVEDSANKYDAVIVLGE